MSERYVVCDSCGYFYGLINPDPTPECPRCGSDLAAWTFPEIEAALMHSGTIHARLQSDKMAGL